MEVPLTLAVVAARHPLLDGVTHQVFLCDPVKELMRSGKHSERERYPEFTSDLISLWVWRQCNPSEMLTRSMDRLALRASPLTARSISVDDTLSVICSQLRDTPRTRAPNGVCT